MIVSIRWSSALLASLPIVPVFLSEYLSGLAFSPRGLIHSHEILPLFFAILAPPPAALSAASRLVQAAIVYRLSSTALPFAWAFTYALCLIRSLAGFVFTRAVGWAIPAWFSHYSLYEPLAGLGPGTYAYLTLVDKDLPGIFPPMIAIAFCWTENAPWTYGISSVVIICVKLLLLIRDTALGRWSPRLARSTDGRSYSTSSTTPLFEDAGLPEPAVQGGEKTPPAEAYASAKPCRSTPTSLTWYSLLPLLATLPYFLVSAPRLPFPQDTTLEILMLSFPRPIDIDLAATMINATINSFVPYVTAPSVTMAAFTHSAQHDALQLVSASHPGIPFHVDLDSHSEDLDGHYLHLAETFRWASEDRRAEWFMLVEDDFPVCKGGWEVISTVMNMLESRKADGSVDAGFIGTGGR